MNNDHLKVLLVDDHYIVRKGVKELIERADDLRVVGEASTASEALNLVRAGILDLVMLDFNLPDMTGLEVLKVIKKEIPSLSILMFSSFAEDEYALACLRAGASGYVTKDATPEVIQKAVRAAASGEIWITRDQHEKLVAGGEKSFEPHERLTCRELYVLLGISRGFSLTEIGEQLHLSVKTISTHRGKVLDKMGMNNNAELTKYVMTKRLDNDSLAQLCDQSNR